MLVGVFAESSRFFRMEYFLGLTVGGLSGLIIYKNIEECRPTQKTPLDAVVECWFITSFGMLVGVASVKCLIMKTS